MAPSSHVLLGVMTTTTEKLSVQWQYDTQKSQKEVTKLTHKSCNCGGITIATFEVIEIQRRVWAGLGPVMTDARRASGGPEKNAAKNSGTSGGEMFGD